MGKTYRRDPDGCGDEEWGRRAPKKKRSRKPQPEVMDLSWAVERMEAHVSYIVEALVADELIEEDEREEYIHLFTETVCEAGSTYDPTRKGKKSGLTASAVHYMTLIVDAKLANVMDYLAYRRWTLKFQSITDDKETAENDDTFIWSGDKSLSDGCRNVKRLEFKMDVQTLFAMLTGEERMTLAMRLAGFSDVEIAEALTLAFHRPTDRHRVQKVHNVHIEKKARRCGFFPPSEVRSGRS